MELAKQILEKAEFYKDYTAGNLSKITKIKSLSGEEKSVVTLIKGMMEEAGFDEVKIDGLGNVIGRIGNGKKVRAFCPDYFCRSMSELCAINKPARAAISGIMGK